MQDGIEFISKPIYNHDTGKVNHVDMPGIMIDIAKRYDLVRPHPLMGVHIQYDIEVDGMDMSIVGVRCTYKDEVNGTVKDLYKTRSVEEVLAHLLTMKYGREYTVSTMRGSFLAQWQSALQYLDQVYEHTVSFEVVFQSSIPHSMTAVKHDRRVVDAATYEAFNATDTSHYKHVHSVKVR